jgi:hypothetical protein
MANTGHRCRPLNKTPLPTAFIQQPCNAPSIHLRTSSRSMDHHRWTAMNLARSLVIVIRVRARVGSSHPRDKYVLRENPVTDHEPS